MNTRLALPNHRPLPARRNHVTQKVKIAGQRKLYISVHDDEHPAEVDELRPLAAVGRLFFSRRF